MKITHILQNPKIGGVQKFVLSLIPDPYLTDDTFSTIFTRSGTGVLLESYKSKNVHTINFPGKLKPFRPSRFYLWAKRHYHKLYDFLLPLYVRPAKSNIIHTHLYDLLEVSSHLHVATKLQIPLVWTIHGDLRSDASGFGILENALSKAVKRKIPITIVYVGGKPPICEALKKYNEIQILHIPSGIDLDEYSTYSESREDFSKKFRYSPDNFVFGYVGRLSWEKGVDVLIFAFSEVFQKVANLQLLIAGDGPERKKLVQLVNTLGVDKNVCFIGEVKNSWDVLPALDVYVQPSRTEGLGLSILEAMAIKIPVIGTNVGGIPDLISDGISGLLVPPEDPLLLSQAMLNLISNKSLRLKLTNSYSQIIRKYDINNIRMQYSAIYNQLASEVVTGRKLK